MCGMSFIPIPGWSDTFTVNVCHLEADLPPDAAQFNSTPEKLGHDVKVSNRLRGALFLHGFWDTVLSRECRISRIPSGVTQITALLPESRPSRVIYSQASAIVRGIRS